MQSLKELKEQAENKKATLRRLLKLLIKIKLS
jgi:hypothetical protein